MRKIWLVVVVFALAGTGFLVWRQQEAAAKAARVEAEIVKELTEADIRIILESQKQSDLETVLAVSATPETRQMFLRGLREHLALAAEARREGLADDGNFKRNLEYKKNILLAELYRAKLTAESGKPNFFPKEDLEAVLNDPQNAANLEADLKALREIQTAVSKVKDDGFVPPPLQGEAVTRARENWARTKILSDKAKADAEFMSRPEIPLRFRVLEAGILSSDYLRKHWTSKIKATDQEVSEFLSRHPEFNLDAKKQRAEGVLRRALAGEDFAKLAQEFSEHRPSKAKGGSMEIEVATGEWPELTTAVRTIKPGEVVPSIVQSEYGWHVVKLLGMKTKGTSNETVTVQHILFQSKFEQPGVSDPNLPAPFMTANEIARLEIEKQKRNAFVADIESRNVITIPEDFAISN